MMKTFVAFNFLTCILFSQTILAHETMDMSSHNMQMSMSHDHTITHMQNVHGMYGHYPMTREASGTSWQPQSTPMTGLMFTPNNSVEMLQGFANLIDDHQGGHRGNNLTFSTSMLMFMAEKDFKIGTLGFRSMFSLDPLMGKGGYPLLLQTGETANGETPLIDRQHPHDAVMELAATYSLPLSNLSSAFLYIALPGEPALGPPNFMMRWSSMYNPEAPIAHHWLDSTHITYGVMTFGYVLNTLKFELSAFNGREPDQFRWSMEPPKFDSESARITYNPTDDWSLQASYGSIKSPEQLEPNVNTNRATASAIYNKALGENNWQTTFAWGQDANKPGHTLNGYLLESTIQFHTTHTLFGRFEHVKKDELFLQPSPYADQAFNVMKLTTGYFYEFPTWYHAKPGIGALISGYSLPSNVQTAYGKHPLSYMLFARVAIA
ncbi:MAG: hypothetical protein SFW66_10035 [Gammaproteobacteria bacterium]|nr:hypothetical protein [Gammaproteobacteria bacterium]